MTGAEHAEVERLKKELHRAEVVGIAAAEKWHEAVDEMWRRLGEEQALADELAEALMDARVNMADWAAYASGHYREEWDVKGALAACDEALAKWRARRGEGG